MNALNALSQEPRFFPKYSEHCCNIQLTFIADIGNSIMDLPRQSPAFRPDLSQHAFSSDLIVIFININVNLLKNCRLTFLKKLKILY